VHEDMGAHTRALDTALRVAEEHDVQVALHSDGLNECLSVEDTLRVLEGRTVHAFHIEGCGGGHVPNVLKMAGVPNVIGSSTNPTLPFGRDAVAEHYGMIVSVHDLKTDLPGDAAMARDRIRAGTMGAEDVLHDLGAIGITSSDAQGMGRAGETVRRTFAMAGKMKAEFGAPDATAEAERAAVTPAAAKKLAALVTAAWAEFDDIVAVTPEELRKGPRGGGRDRDKMVDHVLGAEAGYARKIGVKLKQPAIDDIAAIDELRTAIAAVLGTRSDGTPPVERGWTARYAARRIAWHVLDHAWEMQDRTD